MKTIIVLLSILISTYSTCFAGIDKPNILIRKSDNVVIGVGYSRFEGVKNIATDYEVKQIEPTEMEGYSQQIKERIDAEIKANKIEQKAIQDATIVKLKNLGLTDAEIGALIRR